MSQEKVQKYKEAKRNRKKIMKRQKRMRIVSIACYVLIACAIVGFLGWSVYDQFIREDPSTELVTLSQEEWASFLEEYNATASSSNTESGSGGETEPAQSGSGGETESGSDSETESGNGGETEAAETKETTSK